MSPNVTIISLIYRSPAYAVGLWKSLLASTPELHTGEAKFYFVANNANSRTLGALKRHQVPFIEFNRAVLSDAQHHEMGFAKQNTLDACMQLTILELNNARLKKLC
jgi:hypothetical protein